MLDIQARLETLRTTLLRLISDGQLTDSELQVLIETRAALDLPPDAVRSLRAEVYHTALLKARENGNVDLRDAELLDRIVQFINGSAWLSEQFEEARDA